MKVRQSTGYVFWYFSVAVASQAQQRASAVDGLPEPLQREGACGISSSLPVKDLHAHHPPSGPRFEEAMWETAV